MRYPSLVFLFSTLPFLPWPGFVRWLSACTRRPPLCPRVVEREFKASYGRIRRKERERGRERNHPGPRTKGLRQRAPGLAKKKDEQYRRISADQRGDETDHATKHRIKRPKFRGGTTDSHGAVSRRSTFSRLVSSSRSGFHSLRGRSF